LSLASQVEEQLRAAYDRRYSEGSENQVTLGEKLGVSRSAINKRLNGRINMTMETIADMAWGLGHKIYVKIFDPQDVTTNVIVSTDDAIYMSEYSVVSFHENAINPNCYMSFYFQDEYTSETVLAEPFNDDMDHKAAIQ
jgi:hypothetical protein